jgi:hypothetical protein
MAKGEGVRDAGVSISVKPITGSVTSRPMDQLILFMVVEKTIGRT